MQRPIRATMDRKTGIMENEATSRHYCKAVPRLKKECADGLCRPRALLGYPIERCEICGRQN